MKTLIANIHHAARNRETLTIGGGQFKAEEVLPLLEALKALDELVAEWDEQHRDEDHRTGYRLDTFGIQLARAVLAKAEDYV